MTLRVSSHSVSQSLSELYMRRKRTKQKAKNLAMGGMTSVLLLLLAGSLAVHLSSREALLFSRFRAGAQNHFAFPRKRRGSKMPRPKRGPFWMEYSAVQ